MKQAGSRKAVALVLIAVVGGVGILSIPFIIPRSPVIPDLPASINIVPSMFAAFVDFESNYTLDAPQYELEPDLSNVFNLYQFEGKAWTGWNDGIKSTVAEHYFAANPSTSYRQFSEVYGENHLYELPSFVTVDSMLHSYHVIFDAVLRRIEENNFTAMIQRLSLHELESSLSQNAALAEGRWKDAALKNAAFFSVALKLLDPSWIVPSEVSQIVNATLELIGAAAGFDSNWFMGQNEDFSQYIPRGHYTRTEALQRYFKAMMWFGRISFRLDPSDVGLSPEENVERGKNETAQAILIASALSAASSVFSVPGDANRTWSDIYDTTSFFVGTSDDLAPYEYQILIREVYGQLTDLSVLQNETALQAFQLLARSCRNPSILSGYLLDIDSVEVNTKGMRFMGQRYVPDSYVLGQLVYDYVGSRPSDSQLRTMPKGLDVMSAFGSDRAWELLQDQTAYLNYTEQMAKLRTNFSNLSMSTWTQNLYWLWLYAMRSLLRETAPGHPSFMMSESWVDKELVTSLGTWTELRHDTVLYVKQSYTSDYTSVPSPPVGYAEPLPTAYARLRSLCDMMLRGLSERNLMDEDISGRLTLLADILARLQAISVKELNSEALDADDEYLLRYMGQYLVILEGLDENGGEASLVVDVHTDTYTGRVLEEATGRPMVIFVAVPTPDGEPFIARGAMYSYYEFNVSMAERMTDEEWWALLEAGGTPSMPDWTDSWVIHSSTPRVPVSQSTMVEIERSVLTRPSSTMLVALVMTTMHPSDAASPDSLHIGTSFTKRSG